MRVRSILAVLAVTGALAACGAPSDPALAPPAATDQESPMPSPTDRPARDKDHSQLVDAARADLAGRIDADPADIQVDRVMDVTWRDGSMGCPEPDQMYTQALVDGAYIELIHDGDSYAYHWGIHLDDPFLCEQSDGPPDDHAEY